MISPQEEYLARHKLFDVPVIQHVEAGTVILTQDNPMWTVLSIKWKDNPIHPGEYHLHFLSPIHNGYKDGTLFQKMDELILQYDEYEQFLYEWAKSREVERWGLRAIEGEWPAILACWEMFVNMFDNWFVEHTSPSLKRLLFESIDPDQDISDRLSSYQESLLVMSEHHPQALKRFKFEVLPHAHIYCDWLAKLVNRP